MVGNIIAGVGGSMKTEKFKCRCGKFLKGRKVTLDSRETIVCPKCKRKHYVDGDFIDWKKANISVNIH